MVVREQDVLLPNGLRLHVVESGEPTAAPVLLIHGYAGSSDNFCRLWEIPEPSFRFIAPDLRGHGKSDHPDTAYTIEAFAEDCFSLMDVLSIEKAVLAGHSMGGFIAINMARFHPERVVGLGLISTAALGVGNAALQELSPQVEALSDPVDIQFIKEFQTAPIPQEYVDRLVEANKKMPAYVWKRALASLLAADTTAFLSTIKCPTTIFWGRDDLIFPAADQEVLQKGFPNAPFKTYVGGHCAHAERPDEFRKDFVALLNRTRNA